MRICFHILYSGLLDPKGCYKRGRATREPKSSPPQPLCGSVPPCLSVHVSKMQGRHWGEDGEERGDWGGPWVPGTHGFPLPQFSSGAALACRGHCIPKCHGLAQTVAFTFSTVPKTEDRGAGSVDSLRGLAPWLIGVCLPPSPHVLFPPCVCLSQSLPGR